MIPDEEARAAKKKLDLAVQEYYQTTAPELYMDDWVLVAHAQPLNILDTSYETTADQDTTVNVLPRTGQPFYRTTGLLAEALGD